MPHLIGTGFIIATSGREALAISAAHNFIHAAKVQRPWSLSHPTAPSEFTINMTQALSVDSKSLRAVHKRGAAVDFCTIGEVNFVPELDIALAGC
jgi:hypothetical protein